jgi:hypothetical protein
VSRRLWMVPGLLVLAIVAAGCNGDPKGGGTPTTAAGTGGAGGQGGEGDKGGGGAGGAAPACGPAALCSRTIDECRETISPADCAAFYANPANCADMPGYTSCNCDCIVEATCSDYFACGNLCFNEFCQ